MAAQDDAVRSLAVTDAAGIVRAASDHRLIGHADAVTGGEAQIASAPSVTVTAIGSEAFRFRGTIRYAGVAFGRVDLVLRRTALNAALADARALLLALAVIAVTAAAAIGAMSARAIARSLRRIRTALEDVARGDLAFRISHDRDDEFGQVFDAFNLAIDTIEPQLAAAAEPPLAAVAPTQQAA